MLSILLTLAAGLPLGAPTTACIVPPSLALAFGESYDLLVDEYEEAYTQWRAAIKATSDSLERKALRDAPPALEFWPRFEALASDGEGEALLWMADHLRDMGVKSKERGELLRPLFDRMVAGHADEVWFQDVPAQVYKQRRYLGEEHALALLVRIEKESEVDETRAVALLTQAQLLGKTEGAEERIAALYERVEKEFPDTAAAAEVRVLRLRGQTVVGKSAPDFTGTTIDDFEFKLSEYRGQVVVLDFYGFW